MYGSLFGQSSTNHSMHGDTKQSSLPLSHHSDTPLLSTLPPPSPITTTTTTTTFLNNNPTAPAVLTGGNDGCNDIITAIMTQEGEGGGGDGRKNDGATILSCIINLSNTIIGAGMLGLPGAFQGTGYIGGTILIVVGALFSANGLQLLSKAAQKAGLPSSFYSVAKAAVPQYTILIDLAVTLKCFGVATGYLITVSDCMVDAFDHIILTGNPEHDDSIVIRIILSRQFWIVGAIIAVLPVSFYKTLNELKKASALALVFVFFLTFGIIAYANGLADPCLDANNINYNNECLGDVEAFTTIPRTISKLPIFVFAFTCHQNIFPIVNEIQNRNQTRINIVIACSIGFAFLLFYVVAIEGYNTFGSNVQGDILLNYPQTFNVTILRICIAFMLTLHYPLQLDPSRRCITSLIHVLKKQQRQQEWFSRSNSINPIFDRRYDLGIGNSHNKDNAMRTDQSFQKSTETTITTPYTNNISNTTHNNNDDDFLHATIDDGDGDDDDDRLFYGITISFLLLSFCVAMIVDDLGVVLALVGATGSTLVSYVLPGLIYVKIHPSMDLSKVAAYIQLGLGCLIMPIALYFVLKGNVSH